MLDKGDSHFFVHDLSALPDLPAIQRFGTTLPITLTELTGIAASATTELR